MDPRLESAVLRLGLLEPGGVERVFTAASEIARPAGRAPTAIVALDGARERLLLRRLRHGGLLGPLLRGSFVGLSRPLGELRITAALHAEGAPVPRPALVVGRRRFGPLFECALATVFEEDALDALAFLERETEPGRVLAAARATGEAVRRVHDAGLRHADLHVKNLLLRERGGAFECVVVDLDRAQLVPVLSADERMGQIARLWRSLRKRGVLGRVGVRGCARFFSAYCADDRPLRRTLWRFWPRERRRAALHSWRYRRES